MSTAEQYLKPSVVRQIKRLDLRAQFIVKGFMQGLHASPFHGFSVEFSEHRKYTEGDDPKDIDWLVYAKTDKYYVKKFEAETNITGYLAVDLSGSMGYTHREPQRGKKGDDGETLTKFEYCICLAAALTYLMVHQQDPVGLIAFDEKIRQSLPPRSKRSQLANILSLLSRLEPTGKADVAASLIQLGAMLRHRSLVMIFSDLLHEEPARLFKSLRQLRHGGHDVILFHVFDESESLFPFTGMVEFEDPETGEKMVVDADAFRKSYLESKDEYLRTVRGECAQTRIDYLPLHTGMPFDKALMEYLLSRQARG